MEKKNEKLLSIQRRNEIRSLLLEKENITVKEVMSRFGVSVETVRRDFDILAQEGFLNKVYGGAALKKRTAAMSRDLNDHAFSEGKERVIARVLRFMKPGDTIFLDHSRYVFRMCKGLMDMNITVLTNSLPVMEQLSASKTVQVIGVGGRYSPGEQAFLGPTASRFLKQFQVDRAFFSCKSFDMNRGLAAADERVADMKRTMLECAEQSCLLAEHSMFGKISFASFGTFDDIQYLFTDEKVSDEWRSFLERKGVKLYECTKHNETRKGKEEERPPF